MAAILITASNGLFSVTLDRWDWTGLTITTPDGGHLPIQLVNGVWQYTQPKIDVLNFVASANNVTTIGPDNNFLLKGTDHSYSLFINYSPPGQPFKLQGNGVTNAPRDVALPGPFSFSQGMMTGTFQHG